MEKDRKKRISEFCKVYKGKIIFLGLILAILLFFISCLANMLSLKKELKELFQAEQVRALGVYTKYDNEGSLFPSEFPKWEKEKEKFLESCAYSKNEAGFNLEIGEEYKVYDNILYTAKRGIREGVSDAYVEQIYEDYFLSTKTGYNFDELRISNFTNYLQEKIPFCTFKFLKRRGKVEYVIWENKKFYAELFNISIKIGGGNKISAKYPMKIVISDGRLTEISFKFRHEFDGSSAWGYPMLIDNLWEYKITYDYQETVAPPTEAQLAYAWGEKME